MIFNKVRIKLREKLNPYLGKRRKTKLINENFTIISNNCWAGHVYRYYDLPYLSPTIGCYFFADDYIKFCYNLKYYLSLDIRFINAKHSKYFKELKDKKQLDVPIGVLDDIEIVFLHYKDENEAKEKWTRRKKRVNYGNIYFKFSEMNNCNKKNIIDFDNLPTTKKIQLICEKKYCDLTSTIYIGKELSEINNDTDNFKDYFDITNWLNC